MHFPAVIWSRTTPSLRLPTFKIESPLDVVNLDILAYLDHNITVNIIKNGQIVGKKNLTHPKKITNIVVQPKILLLE